MLLIFTLALQINVLVFPGSALWHAILTDYLNTKDSMLRGVPTSLFVTLHPIGLLIKDTLFPVTALSTHSPSCEDRLLQTEPRKHRPHPMTIPSPAMTTGECQWQTWPLYHMHLPPSISIHMSSIKQYACSWTN